MNYIVVVDVVVEPSLSPTSPRGLSQRNVGELDWVRSKPFGPGVSENLAVYLTINNSVACSTISHCDRNVFI